MNIALDAMGGDLGPQATVAGAVLASREYKIDVALVGDSRIIEKEFNAINKANSKVTIIDASESIGMEEGIFSFRKKKSSSIRIGTQMLREKKADAFVSVGNTAAVVYISKKVLGALKGVEQPALSLLVPSLKGYSLFLDVGANANCRPNHLVQFAIMGQVFMRSIMGIDAPRIALMSIGEERSKGNDLTKEAFKILQNSSMNFIGNLEGKDIYSGKADVIVSDGFTGNVALKASEGMIETSLSMAKSEIMKNLFAKIGFYLMKRNLKKIYKKFDYSEYGGAHLLGLNGVCVIGHGRSNPHAVKNAIKVAYDFVTNKVQDKIQNELSKFFHLMEGIKI